MKHAAASPTCPFSIIRFDFSWAVGRTLRQVDPALIVLAEGELWPDFLLAARRQGVPVAVVNGRMSPRSAARYRRLRWLTGPLFDCITLYAAQTEEYADAVRSLGAAPERVHVTGSVKYDGCTSDRHNPRTEALRRLLNVPTDDLVWVAGSTMAPEEEIVIGVYQRARAAHPNLRLFLAPRQKDRFNEAADILRRAGIPFIRRTELTIPLTDRNAVVLVDTIGELGALWGLADVAFVGGSLDGRRGGQNMIEPAAYGAAVVFGPHVWNFKAPAAHLIEHGAARQVKDAEELESAVLHLLTSDANERKRMGSAARAFVQKQQGATESTVRLLGGLLNARPGKTAAARHGVAMKNVKPLIRQLTKYALGNKGAEQGSGNSVQLPGGLWTKFFDVESADNYGPEGDSFWNSLHAAEAKSGYEYFAYLPVYAARLKEHQRRYPAIIETQWTERDGHIQMAVPLDAGLPVDFLKSLIDEAYEIAWNKLDSDARLQIELAGLPYDEPKLIDRLIEIHDLKKRRKAIHNIARRAPLLLTKKSSEIKIPVGATKIGGRPDLPAATEWPVYTDGKPLAFLAQINLTEIANLGTPIKGLPTDGLLSVFSVWGRMEEGAGDPDVPAEGWQEQAGWTAILHTPPQATLERRKTPRGVNSFKAAAVESTPTLSLPRHRAEPPLAALGLTDDEYERFDRLQSDYHSLQMKHWLKSSNAGTSHHLLGGYAIFQQEFPLEVLEKGLAMLLQIGSDANTAMCWGDEGELTFYADAKALAQGKFERIWVIYQCG